MENTSQVEKRAISTAAFEKNMPLVGFTCWVCGSDDLRLAKPSNISVPLGSSSFAITDSNYGRTGEIHRCSNCGFLQCSRQSHVLQLYEDLEDASYEAGRSERSLQAEKLLQFVQEFRRQGRLLDIGAGSGILVEQALKMGYVAEGVEPSRWLQAKAKEHGLVVHLGTFPHSEVAGLFDVVTLVDVLEHVPEPVSLLRQTATILARDGLLLIVTPDVGSVAARLLGWKWWHFRVAHVGYFNRRTLFLALDRAGMKPIVARRPGWYFNLEYLTSRAHRYLPPVLRVNPPNVLKHFVVPLNLRDSLSVVARKG